MHENVLKKLFKIKAIDFLSLFLLILAIIPSLIYKRKRTNMYLICEYAYEAHDNAYWLYKYIRENHPDQDVVYAIKKDSPEYKKVEHLGEVVEYGSLKHWIYYLSAKANISSQKGGKPNAAVCYIFEIKIKLIKTNNIFLQHGVILSDLPYLHSHNAKIDLFICSAKAECEFISSKFNYPISKLAKVGLCRFDTLDLSKYDKRKILIAPTWRNWLTFSNDSQFTNTEYYKAWQTLLCNERFISLIEERNLDIYFYPHIHMQKYIDCFSSKSDRIKILNWESVNFQNLINEAALMITDYSSVAVDFAYCNKRIIYYQFDYTDYREKHQPLGYFSYKEDGFGPVCYNCDDMLEEFKKATNEDFVNLPNYEEKVNNFFFFRDKKNCERTYNAIGEMLNSKKFNTKNYDE